MNTLQVLRQQLMLKPDDDALAAALTDLLIEENGYSPHGARCYVGRDRAAARRAARFAAAVELLGQSTSTAKKVRKLIRDAVGGFPPTVPIDVIEGPDAPDWTGEPGHTRFRRGGVCQYPGAARRAGYKVEYVRDTRRITVGSEWIHARVEIT